MIGRLFERGPIDWGWLVRNGRVLASLEIPRTRRGRALGLIGREGIEGAMLLRPARSVHSFGMRFELDVAFVDAEGVVVRTVRLHRNRITPPVWRARAVIEAEAGAFGRWELSIGDEVEIRWTDDGQDDGGGPGTTDGSGQRSLGDGADGQGPVDEPVVEDRPDGSHEAGSGVAESRVLDGEVPPA